MNVFKGAENMLPNNVHQVAFTGLNNSTCASKTIYIRTMSGMRLNDVRENGAPVGIQAILEAGHCRSFSMFGGSLFHGPAERTAKAAFRLAR